MNGDIEKDDIFVKIPGKILSKSSYLLGLQCLKLLWVKVHDKTRIPDPDDFAMYRFRVGDETEAMAKTLFEGGIDIPRDDFLKNLEMSKIYLEKRVPLFEPAFEWDQLYSRADVLVPVGEDEWDIVEMKSATKVKDVNLHDVSFQKYVYEQAGLKIRKCFLMYINRDYQRYGEIEPSKLFIQTDITEEVLKISQGIEDRIESMLRIVNSTTEPGYSLGSHCSDPYECPIKKECWADLPGGNILEFYQNLDMQCFEIEGYGKLFLRRISDFHKNGSNKSSFKKQIEATKKKDIFEKEVISSFMKQLSYPLHFLDVTSINPAVPKYNGMKPYKRIPFQFSLYTKQHPLDDFHEISFVAHGTKDPRRDFLTILKEHLEDNGSIIVFDKHETLSLFSDLAWIFRDFGDWIHHSFSKRLVGAWDLLDNFHFYDVEKSIQKKIRYLIPRFENLEHGDLMILYDEIRRGLDFEHFAYSSELFDKNHLVFKKIERHGRERARTLHAFVEALRKLDKL